jgi:xylulokinase
VPTELVAGVDSSTQSTKIELRERATGTIVATGRAPHPATAPPRSEQDPNAWWGALGDACGQVRAHLAAVTAVSVGGQQHGMVVVDRDDTVIRPAKLWNDTESAPQADALVERLGAEGWARACGSVPVASFTITKLAWLAAHEPDGLARVAKVMLPHDWLTWRLTGEHVTDRGDASGTGWWDPGTGDYRPDLLAMVDGRDDWELRLPAVLGPTAVAGTVTADAAAATGLPEGAMVGPGTGDNMAAALGLGLAPGDVALSLGTSGTAYARSSSPTADQSGLVAGFADASGAFLPLVCTLNATKVTDTVGRWLGLDHEAFAAAALAAESGVHTPVLVPYFDGERTPNLPDATGWWSGLRNDTSREDLAMAAHEGVVCGLLAGVDALAAAGASVDGTLHLIGGGARSAAYRRVVADLHGAPIVVPDDDETVATGACVQAAMVLGDDLAELGPRWRLGAGITIEPEPGVDGAARRVAYAEAASAVAGVS